MRYCRASELDTLLRTSSPTYLRRSNRRHRRRKRNAVLLSDRLPVDRPNTRGMRPSLAGIKSELFILSVYAKLLDPTLIRIDKQHFSKRITPNITLTGEPDALMDDLVIEVKTRTNRIGVKHSERVQVQAYLQLTDRPRGVLVEMMRPIGKSDNTVHLTYINRDDKMWEGIVEKLTEINPYRSRLRRLICC